MPTSEATRSDAASIRARLGHPIVDADGHIVESVPALVDLMRRVAGSEVADRFAAKRGSPDYGLPSVISSVYTDAYVAFRVPPQVFYPSPRVESAVVVMTRKQTPENADRAVELARAGFGQRRKMLRRSLSSVLEDPTRTLEEAGIDPTSRAEELSSDDYLRLAGIQP